MNVLEGLQTIRQRLVENGAIPETLALVDTIMKRADGMMYQAKRNGKARYEVSPHLFEAAAAETSEAVA